MAITCKGDGTVHSHETVAEVRACWQNNARGPKPAGGPRAQVNAKRIEEQERNTAAYRRGERHDFTSHCPMCVAGTHYPPDVRDLVPPDEAEHYAGTPLATDAEMDRMVQQHEREQDEEIYRSKMERDDRLLRTPRANKYPGSCGTCGGRVKASEGILTGNKRDGYGVQHKDGECPEQAKPVDRSPLPDVPEGHYAITSLTGNNDLDFFRVDHPTEDGRVKTYVKRIIGGKPDRNIKWGQYREVLNAIVKAGVDAASLLYSQKIRACRFCNRHLTQFASRQLGCGSTCAETHGMGDLWYEIQSEWERNNPGRDAKDLKEEEGWLDQQTLQQRMHREDALAAAEEATWD